MNKEQLKGEWNQLKGKVKQQWGKLTDDDLTRAEGDQDELIGCIQKRYGIAKEEAERQFRDFAQKQQAGGQSGAQHQGAQQPGGQHGGNPQGGRAGGA
jgi:uncharacterized protein YjbJ (UPF0337 family)